MEVMERQSGDAPDFVGVPTYDYVEDISDLGIYLFMGGLFLGGFAAIAYLCGQIFHGLALAIALLIGCGVCIPLLLYGITFYREIARTLNVHCRLLGKLSADTMCRRFGMDEAALQQLAREHKVQPRYIVDGKVYYSLLDFGDMSILLRASTQPAATSETLLRPADSKTEATIPEQLLRAAD